MDDCIFCKIVKGEIKTKFERETRNLVMFEDIHPLAPIHFLIVTKKHLSDLNLVSDSLWLEIKNLALNYTKEKSYNGFRLAVNVGEAAFVKHMHTHYLSGISKDRNI